MKKSAISFFKLVDEGKKADKIKNKAKEASKTENDLEILNLKIENMLSKSNSTHSKEKDISDIADGPF